MCIRDSEHLASLQARHAATLAALGSAAPSPPDYTCKEGAHSVPEPWKVQGTSLGGWLVLEPWLTPSLFYQFLGADVKYGPDIEKIKEKTAMDQHSFCKALGPKEANRQLRKHWTLWVTEEHIKEIASTGSTHVRIPIGDWMFTPYDVYDEVEDGVRCNDGARDELDLGFVQEGAERRGPRVLEYFRLERARRRRHAARDDLARGSREEGGLHGHLGAKSLPGRSRWWECTWRVC